MKNEERKNLLTMTCSEKWEEAAEFASNFDTPLYSVFKNPKYAVDWLMELLRKGRSMTEGIEGIEVKK